MEPVETRLISKSIGCCKRFPGKNALTTTEDVIHWLSELAEEISERLEQDLQENNRRAKQIVLSFAQEFNKKDVHSSRTMLLNSYDAKKITDDTFDNLKRHTQKSDGSFHIKFLGLSAGKFENTKNVYDISTFFKKDIEKNQDLFKNESTTTSKPKINDLKNYFDTNETEIDTTQEVSSRKEENIQKNIDIFNETHKNATIFHSKSKSNTLTNYFISKNTNTCDKMYNENIYKTEKSSSPISLEINDKNSIESIQNNIKNKISDVEQKNMFLNVKKNDTNNINNIFFNTQKTSDDFVVEKMNFDVSQNEISLNDIENDAIMSDASNTSETTVEMDFSRILQHKSEFPHREINSESPKREKSPVQNGKSFFLRYIKKFEPSTSLNVQNESCPTVEDTKIDITYEICPECQENIPKKDFLSHSDYHIAFKLMNEEKKLFKESLEQRKVKKSPVKELNKSKKRKIVENNSNITAFFVPKTNAAEKNSEICKECGKSVLFTEIDNHNDFHAAKKLHLELNPVKIVAKNSFKSKKNDKSVNCLTNFFKPK